MEGVPKYKNFLHLLKKILQIRLVFIKKILHERRDGATYIKKCRGTWFKFFFYSLSIFITYIPVSQNLKHPYQTLFDLN